MVCRNAWHCLHSLCSGSWGGCCTSAFWQFVWGRYLTIMSCPHHLLLYEGGMLSSLVVRSGVGSTASLRHTDGSIELPACNYSVYFHCMQLHRSWPRLEKDGGKNPDVLISNNQHCLLLPSIQFVSEQGGLGSGGRQRRDHAPASPAFLLLLWFPSLTGSPMCQAWSSEIGSRVQFLLWTGYSFQFYQCSLAVLN